MTNDDLSALLRAHARMDEVAAETGQLREWATRAMGEVEATGDE